MGSSVGDSVGDLEGAEVVGFLLGEGDGWSVDTFVGFSVVEAVRSAVGFCNGGPLHNVESQRHKSGNSDATFEHASASL